MSAVDYKASLERLVSVMRGKTGYTVEDIVKIILIEEAKWQAPQAEPKAEPVRIISVELTNGATKPYRDTPQLREQLAKEARAKEVNATEADSDEDLDELIKTAEKHLAMLRAAKDSDAH
jgi:hypothetical protein